eukprot:5126694-Pleurochrysis_carterae.AAC.1
MATGARRAPLGEAYRPLLCKGGRLAEQVAPQVHLRVQAASWPRRWAMRLAAGFLRDGHPGRDVPAVPQLVHGGGLRMPLQQALR